MKTIIISILLFLSLESMGQKGITIVSQDGSIYQIDTSRTVLQVLSPLVIIESLNGDTVTIAIKKDSTVSAKPQSFDLQPAQKAGPNQKSFVFKNVPADYRDYWIFKTIVTKAGQYLMYLMQPIKDYTTVGNTITFKSISLGSIIDFRQIR